MRQNGGCALEKLVGERWLPVALRYQRFTANERRALDRGEIVSNGGTSWRRHDWAERQALVLVCRAFPKQ